MIILIAAVADNGCIGKDGSLPWRIPEDLVHFQKLTTGHRVVMGRKTWESLPEKFRPLPNRENVVVTRDAGYTLPVGVIRASSLSEALQGTTEDVYVIGGAQIYAEAFPLAQRMEITQVHQSVDGDAFFPAMDASWEEVSREEHDGYSFVRYEKVS